MELRTWAEQLLFGDRLDDKLVPITDVSDDAPGPGLALPDAPGRPQAWTFSSERAPFPRQAELADPRARGTMLHFFANHELLAIELFALGLLRFPDAPSAFRRGLARTIAEEQAHLGLYLDRMQQLGVQPGQVPVNRFFWDCLHDVPGPYDLCLRMGLVFEQANLDYCLHFSDALRQVEDEASAAILDRVLEDEIGHVKQGLHWFRRWKDAGQSDWDAFVAGLSLPLSPSRARGPVLSRALRQRVGFDDDFVDRLAVFGRSKGRPPAVWWWNPDCEAERLDGHRPSAAVRVLQQDLAALPWVLAAPDDVVLVDTPPRIAWLQQLQAAGFALPEFTAEVGERMVGALRPWGWSPAAEARLGALREAQVPGAVEPTPDTAAFRKDRAAAWLAAWGQERGEDLAVLGGVSCTTWQAVEQAAAALAAEGWTPAVKPVLSTAGQGILRRVEQAAVCALLEQQPAVLVVPWLPRELDLSLHFDVQDDGARFAGFTTFQATAGGSWRRSLVSRPDVLLEPSLLRFLHGRHPRGLSGYGRALAAFLAPRLAALGVRGPVGIDMLVGRDPRGRRLLHPLLEVNPRFSMGRVALALRPRVAARRVAWLELVRDPPQGADVDAGPQRDAQGRIASGRLWLTDPLGARVAAALTVDDAVPRGTARR